MLYEFAMLPDIFKEATLETDDKGVLLFSLLRDMKMNGLLANLDKDGLYTYIQKLLLSEDSKMYPGMEQKTKDKILECLSWLDTHHRFVRHPKSVNGPPMDDLAWLNLALKSHEICPFQAIVLGKPLMNNYGKENSSFVEFSKAQLSPKWECIGEESETFKKNEDNYRKWLEPVLKHAKVLHLVDYFFNYKDYSGYPNTLEICADLLGKRKNDGKIERVKREISIHASYFRLSKEILNPKDWFDGWAPKLKVLTEKYHHTFRLFLWEPEKVKKKGKSEKDLMHERFLITDQIGINCGFGLDCYKKSTQDTTWLRLSPKDWQTQWENCIPGPSKYELVDKKEYP